MPFWPNVSQSQTAYRNLNIFRTWHTLYLSHDKWHWLPICIDTGYAYPHLVKLTTHIGSLLHFCFKHPTGELCVNNSVPLGDDNNTLSATAFTVTALMAQILPDRNYSARDRKRSPACRAILLLHDKNRTAAASHTAVFIQDSVQPDYQIH